MIDFGREDVGFFFSDDFTAAYATAAPAAAAAIAVAISVSVWFLELIVPKDLSFVYFQPLVMTTLLSN